MNQIRSYYTWLIHDYKQSSIFEHFQFHKWLRAQLGYLCIDEVHWWTQYWNCICELYWLGKSRYLRYLAEFCWLQSSWFLDSTFPSVELLCYYSIVHFFGTCTFLKHTSVYFYLVEKKHFITTQLEIYTHASLMLLILQYKQTKKTCQGYIYTQVEKKFHNKF